MESAVADRIQIEETIAGQNTDDWRSFTNQKRYQWLPDQQNGNYSNQVSYDLSSIVSGNQYLSVEESYILMPMSTTIAIPGSGGATLTAPAAWTSERMTLKDNYINFIDSIQLFVNGEQLIDQTTFSNFPLQIIDKLTMSQDDLKLEGSGLGIYPDTTTSIRYSGPNATISGDGYTNGTYLGTSNETTVTGLDYSLMNEGMKQRQLNTFITPTSAGSAVNGWPPALSNSGTGGSNNFTQILCPYFSAAAASSLAVQGVWNYVVYLPLTRLGDLFKKYPLVKGSQIRLVINFNAGVATMATDMTANNAKLKMISYTATAGNTNPVMCASNYINPITSTSTAGNLTFTTKIQTTTVAAVSTTTGQAGYATLPQCRIYCCLYKINPTYEERMIKNRIQRVRYCDWYQQPVLNISNGASFSQTLSTALTNVQYLIGLPFQNASGLFATATGMPQFQSLFDTAPATTVPGGMLAFQNFNVSVSGENIFNQAANYSHDIFVQEVQKLGLNAGLNQTLASGLLDFNTWLWSPVIVVDLSRRPETADGTYQSVVVQGTNNSGVAIDYYFFIAYQKEAEFDIITGNAKKVF